MKTIKQHCYAHGLHYQFLSFFLVLTLIVSGMSAYSQDITVQGKINSDKGESLPGVSIKIKGTTTSTVSDANGNFKLNVSSNATLVFTYIGFITQEVPLKGRSSVSVILKEETTNLDEVVVVGYGTQKRVNLTGSVSTVSGATLTERPAPNAANLLQGRAAGLQVTQPSSEPGRDNPSFVLRGQGSFNNGTNSQALVLIDGVTGSFNNLSPDDIENVTVLKDAASASIYGARAANGVILVTTKKGKRGKTSISYRANVARHVPTALPDLVTNSAEYMEMFNAAAPRSAGVTFRYSQAEIDNYRNATDRITFPNFDNIDYYINPATVSNHNLSLSGGTDKSLYNISFGYLDQNAFMKGYKFKRYNALLNYSNDVSKVITVGTTINATYRDRKEPPFTSENITLAIYAAGPLYGPFLPDGSGRVVSRAYGLEGRNRNPQEYYAMGNQNTKEYNLNAQGYIDVKPLKGLTWSTKFAVNYTDEYYKMYQQPYTAYLFREKNAAGDYIANSFGPDILGVTDQYTKVITPTIYSTVTYDTKIGTGHNLKLLGGYEQIFYKNQYLRGRRINTVATVLDDLTGYLPTGESLYFTHPRLPSPPSGAPSEWALQSFFGRFNYDFKGKYLLEGNLRYDGTSKVSPDYRWGLFPSVSAGWLVSEENFLKDNVQWLSSLKLRGSYGELGNQDVNAYLYQDNLTISNVFYPFGNGALQQGAVNNTYREESLKWETTSVIDFGLDLSVRNGLFGLTFDWFRKTTFDILASQPIPLSLGLTAPTFNNGKMRNQGIELGLNHQNKIGEFSYGANLLLSTARNKVLQIGVPSKGTSINEVGLPYGSHFLYEWDGIFQEEDINNPAVPKHALNPTPRAGDIKMKDQDGDGDVDADDRIVMDGVYPDFLYSFGLNFGFKRFSLNAFFQGVEGIKNRVTGWGVDPFHQGAAPAEKWRNAWTPENRSNTMPAIYVQGYPAIQNYTGSSYFLQDASYLRLKNIMLSYSFPASTFSRIGLKDLGIYVSADNLFTVTKYEGGDPERSSPTGNFAQYPQARIYNVGLNVKF